MKKAFVILFAMVMLATTACLPTPEVEPIPNKADAVAESIINATPAITTDSSTGDIDDEFILPNKWEDEIKTQDWTVPIQADVITSGQDTFPVRIVREKEFSISEVERLANLFFPNIIALMEGNRYTVSEYERSIQNRVNLNRLESAQRLAMEMQSDEVQQNTYREATVISVNTLPQTIRVQTGEKSGTVSVSSRSIELQEAADGAIHWKELVEEEGSFEGDTPKPVCPQISYEEAAQASDEFLKAAGIEGFSPITFREVRFFDLFFSEEISIGWSIEYAKSYEYYPFNTSLGGRGPLVFDTEPVSKPWDNEMITVYISEQGEVQYFRWDNPTEVAAVANDNVQLMPLEELEPVMKRMIAYGLPSASMYQGNPVPFGYAMKITKLYLSVTLQTVKDDVTKAYVMPTWICCVEVFDINMETNQIREPAVDYCYYGFNAIDGTYVNLRSQYVPDD